jgi:hypothetical protein
MSNKRDENQSFIEQETARRLEAVVRRIEMAPEISTKDIPAQEHAAIAHLNDALGQFSSHVQQFDAALKLFDFCQVELSKSNSGGSLNPCFQWQFIAARDGAMAIFHFGKAMEHIAAFLWKCPTVLGKIDKKQCRAARKALGGLVPGFEAVRHSVAHAGELMKDEETSDLHSVSIPQRLVEKMVLTNCLQGRLFQNTYEGKIQEYEISHKTLDGLIAIRNDFYSAFMSATDQIPSSPPKE